MVAKKYENMSLADLEKLIGKDQIDRLFLEYYLELIGKNKNHVKLADGLTLNDIMEE